VPLECLPNVAAAQPELAARIEALGVGLALDGDAATPAEIGDAVSRTLRDPAYRARAGRLARVFAAAPGLSAVVSELERIAGFERRPISAALERGGPRIGAD
jgi:UDP:flavonoid glycosyltransferase YjiC (YdhE family)